MTIDKASHVMVPLLHFSSISIPSAILFHTQTSIYVAHLVVEETQVDCSHLALHLAMAKSRNFEGLKKTSIGILRFMVEKLLTSLPILKVREGHFVVVATEGWEPKRFVIELGYLHHPEFLKLLKLAEEEFGFSQEGALAVPCRPDELQRILHVRKL
ncbi:SAUR-like auxin-responsive protein family [Melia azedarach]|uniref:SAUR-like auxin-responsive protein family n=1 Tax=Melia azedarach TaxID=155640 RepID=A0ACC1X228_MELAZ|nr:SAUR-like auxin-responsive protein family [Melia azedarach]